MTDHTFLADYFDRYRRSLFAPEVHGQLISLKEQFLIVDASGRKTIIAGNGGSAGIAGHCAVDFVKNAGLRCMNFNDTGLVTSLANDYGYERWIEKALELYASEGDVVVLVSSSGHSPNVLRAADYARSQGYYLVTFTGFAPDNPLRQKGQLNFWVDSRAYNIVEMTHQIWLLAVCDMVIGRAEYEAVR